MEKSMRYKIKTGVRPSGQIRVPSGRQRSCYRMAGSETYFCFKVLLEIRRFIYRNAFSGLAVSCENREKSEEGWKKSRMIRAKRGLLSLPFRRIIDIPHTQMWEKVYRDVRNCSKNSHYAIIVRIIFLFVNCTIVKLPINIKKLYLKK